VWTGIGDAYAGAYTLVTTGGLGINNGAMAVVSGTNLGTAITWGSAGTGNPISTNSLTYVLGFTDYGATAADVGGATDLNASAMCAAACTALPPWNMDAATFLPIVQATAAMTTAECTGF